ncbi:MAG: TIM barrel protein [Oligosphaeraceae bacterium]|nr:TIM barrel protein [Oligosphaeraceae bacterium]
MLKLCPLIDLFFTQEKCWKTRAEQIAACGFSAVETWKGANVDELKQMVAGGVKLASIVMNFATEAEVAPCNPKNRAAFVERIEKYAANALEAGCHSGIVTTGQQVGGLSYAAQRAAVVEALAAAAEKLAGVDFTLNLEPLNTEVDHAGYLLSSALDSVAIVREVGSAKIKVLYDFYHMTIMGGNQTEFLRHNWKDIGHCHVAGVPGRHEPANGELNYPFVLAELERLGYTGYIGLEYMPLLPYARSLQETKAYFYSKQA